MTGGGVLWADLYLPAAFIVIVICCIIVIRKLIRYYDEKRIRDYYFHQLRSYKGQIAAWEDELLKARELKNDFCNHLYYLWDKTYEQDGNGISDYLENLIQKEKSGSNDFFKSSNLVVDALVNQKYSVAEKNQIDFQVHISVPYKLPFDDGDICMILGNALDNAIEAAMEAGCEKRTIVLEMAASKHIHTFVVRNTYDGLAHKKKHGGNCALGLSLIREAAKHYRGEILTEKKDHEFSLTLVFYE